MLLCAERARICLERMFDLDLEHSGCLLEECKHFSEGRKEMGKVLSMGVTQLDPNIRIINVTALYRVGYSGKQWRKGEKFRGCHHVRKKGRSWN